MLSPDCLVFQPKSERIVENDIKCSPCKSHQNTHAIYSCIEKSSEGKENHVDPDRHVNYYYLTSPEKTQRLSILHQVARTAQRQVSRLKSRLEEESTAVGETVNDQTHAGLQSIMADSEFTVHERFPPDSFGHIFWEQQKKAAEASTPSSMRWHPLIIKWCLHF